MTESTMTTSPIGCGQLADALAKAQAEMGPAVLDAKSHHGQYASLQSVMKAAAPMYKHGLSFVQMPATHNGLVSLTTRLMHSSGEYLESTLTAPAGQGRGTNPVQGMGSTLSYLRRYALSAMLGIATGEDDDGNGAHAEPPHHRPHERTRRPTNQSSTTRPPEPSARRSKDPNGHWFATCNELDINEATQKILLGVESRRDADPQLMDTLAFWLKTLDPKDMALVHSVANAFSLSKLEEAWLACSKEMKTKLMTAKNYRKQQLQEVAA